MTAPAVSRADLVRAVSRLDAVPEQAIARLLGFEPDPAWRPARRREAIAEPAKLEAEPRPVAPQRPKIRRPFAPVPQWRWSRRETVAARQPDESEPPSRSVVALDADELRTRALAPPPPPIVSPARLRRRLEEALRTPRPSRRLDLDRLVRSLAHGEALRALPYLWGLSPSRLGLILDPSPRLVPFQDDMIGVAARFVQRLGAERVRLLPGPGAEDSSPPRVVDDEIILALSDLGFYGEAVDRESWHRYGRRLEAAGAGLCALVPCPAWRWHHELAELWGAIDWSHPEGAGQRRPPSRSRLAGGTPAPAELLLLLLLPALRIEPSLVRRLRRALGEIEAQSRLGVDDGFDLGTEADLWNHPELDGRTSCHHLLFDEAAYAGWQRRRSEAELGLAWRKKAAEVILEWHGGFSDLFRAVEVLQLAETLEEGGFDPGLVSWAAELLERSARSLEAPRDSGYLALISFLARSLSRFPAAMVRDPRLHDSIVHFVRHLRSIDPATPLPAGLTPDMLEGVSEQKPPRRFIVGWVEDRLVVRPQDSPPLGDELAEIMVRGDEIRIDTGFGAARKISLEDRAVEVEGLAEAARFRLVSDIEVVELERWTRPMWASAAGRDGDGLWAEIEVETNVHRLLWRPPDPSPAGSARKGRFVYRSPRGETLPDGFWRPSWASAAGRDHHGLWASFELDGVEHRLRYIPPGRFFMGSPESEEGRYDDEGPRHEVILTEGFWLGEVPCTQDLWQAVMGENPSRFRHPRRPVEQVSWDDCQLFLERLAERGFAGRLPTEAQWEYACRAGTATATYAGDLEILGANNAPLLDDIAWYAGNSGVNFDLDEGADSSEWPEMQVPSPRSGSRLVGLKQANPWGLHDMLGNVYEWCSDWRASYGPEPAVDPSGPEEGTYRVVRGGSWSGNARRVRAAYRSWNSPGDRHDNLGFRLSRGPERAGPEAGESGRRRGREVRDEPHASPRRSARRGHEGELT